VDCIINIDVWEISANSKVPALISPSSDEPTLNIIAVEIDIKGTPTKTQVITAGSVL